MNCLVVSLLLGGASAFAPVQTGKASTSALYNGPVLGSGGMADTRGMYRIMVHCREMGDGRRKTGEKGLISHYCADVLVSLGLVSPQILKRCNTKILANPLVPHLRLRST